MGAASPFLGQTRRGGPMRSGRRSWTARDLGTRLCRSWRHSDREDELLAAECDPAQRPASRATLKTSVCRALEVSLRNSPGAKAFQDYSACSLRIPPRLAEYEDHIYGENHRNGT